MSLPVRDGVANMCQGGARESSPQNIKLKHGVLFGCAARDDTGKEEIWSTVLHGASVSSHTASRRVTVVKGGKKKSIFFGTLEEFKSWTLDLRRSSKWTLREFYHRRRAIGSGGSAKVYSARCRRTGERVAVKVINTVKMDREELNMLNMEVQIMMKVSHQCVVQATDILRSKDSTCIVQPLMRGGSLRDVIKRQGTITESQAKEVFKSAVCGLLYLHAKGIVHRDVKPENVFLERQTFPFDAKIGDFGISDVLGENGYVEKPCLRGTLGYIAPEWLEVSKCGPALDMWACGVMLYEMLGGTRPFGAPTPSEFLRAITLGHFSFPKKSWLLISKEAKDLIRGLLCVDPSKRLSAQDTLESPWLC